MAARRLGPAAPQWDLPEIRDGRAGFMMPRRMEPAIVPIPAGGLASTALGTVRVGAAGHRMPHGTGML